MKDISRFSALQDLRARLVRLPAVNAKIAERVAPAFSALAQASFAGRRSPYGDAWGTGSTGQPIDLVESGALRSQAIRYSAVGTTIRSSVASVRHARYQLKRGVLPKSKALPVEWLQTLRRIANEELTRAVTQ